MCKYEMDPASIVEDTARTRFCPQTDGRTDGRTTWNQYTPLSTSLKRGYTDICLIYCTCFWNVKWRGRIFYIGHDEDRLNVTEPFANVPVIKLSFMHFAPNPQRDHNNLAVFSQLSVLYPLYGVKALYFNSCHFRFNPLFWHFHFTLIFLYVV